MIVSTLRLGAALALLAGLSGLSAQHTPMARLAASGLWDLYVDAPGPGPASLILPDVEFLPLDLAGFAVRDRLRSGLARPVAGAPAAHVRLPQGGRLLRVSDHGQTRLLQVRPDGTLSTLLSLAENGAPSIADTIHVASAGTLALAASTAGDVWLTDLGGGAPRLLHAAGAAPADPGSLRVSADRAFFVAGGVLHAADLTTAGLAAPVTLAAAGEAVLPESVISGDGLSLALVTEAAGGARQVHVLDEALQAHVVSPAPGLYDTPNFASPWGPWLALSHDGSRVAFRGTLGPASEVFLEVVPDPMPAMQLTADATFVDTIDNVGVLGFAADGKLHFMAGESQAGAPGALGSADLYLATPGSGGSLALSNVTNTSGSAIPPFLQPGELELLDAALDPAGQRLLLVVDPDGGDAALLALPADLGSGEVALLPPLAEPPELHRAGGEALLLLARDAGTGVQGLFHLPSGGTPALLATLPAGISLDRFVDGMARAACVASAAPDLELPLTLESANGALGFPWPLVGSVGAALALAGPGDELVLSVGSGAQLGLRLDGPFSGSSLGMPVGTLVALGP